MKPLIEINNLCYAVNGKDILKDISFNVAKGKIIGIAGESGSGKTTLAKIIAGIIKPTTGSVICNFNRQHKEDSGKEVLVFSTTRRFAQSKAFPIQMLFQNNGEIINPFSTVKSMIGSKEILRMLEIDEHLWNRKGFQLSGGEQQRTALARILETLPEAIILDEPFSAQDPESEQRLVKIFSSINNKKQITLICVSHNIKLLRQFCTDYIIMLNGKIEDAGEMNNIETSKNKYTLFLLKAENFNLKPEEIFLSEK